MLTDTMNAMLMKGATIRDRRLKLGLSKEAMARAADVSVITYKKVEDDKPVRDTSMAMVLAALEREEEKRSRSAAGTFTVTGSATGRADRFPRPSWMGDDEYAAIMADIDDYYRYQIQRAAAARKTPEEHALDDLFGDQAG